MTEIEKQIQISKLKTYRAFIELDHSFAVIENSPNVWALKQLADNAKTLIQELEGKLQ